jgi:2-haloacid dehalogenase
MMIYKTKGVCCSEIRCEIADGRITELEFGGGCPGNLRGIAALAVGRTPGEIIAQLSGIRCKDRPTSCPDQLAQALRHGYNEVKYDTFLFDADNTLYDFDAAELAAMHELFSRHGFTYQEHLRTRYREINAQLWAAFEQYEKTAAEIMEYRWQLLFEEFGMNCGDIPAFSQGFLQQLGMGTQLIDGAEDICRAIVQAGGTIHIITNGDDAVQMARLRGSATSKYISQIFTSGGVGHQKPDTRFFSFVLDNIPQKDKSRMLVIGDSLSADIAGGNASGIHTCWYNIRNEENRSAHTPTYEIAHLRELARFI